MFKLHLQWGETNDERVLLRFFCAQKLFKAFHFFYENKVFWETKVYFRMLSRLETWSIHCAFMGAMKTANVNHLGVHDNPSHIRCDDDKEIENKTTNLR